MKNYNLIKRASQAFNLIVAIITLVCVYEYAEILGWYTSIVCVCGALAMILCSSLFQRKEFIDFILADE